jgi:hypothetical protein
MGAFNLMDLIAFIFEASDKFSNANAPARPGYIKCALKGCFMRIHAAKNNTGLAKRFRGGRNVLIARSLKQPLGHDLWPMAVPAGQRSQ